jgi:hypothetical protein
MTTPADQERRNRAAFNLMRDAVLQVPAKRAAGASDADIDAFMIGVTAIAEAAKSADEVDEITALRLGQS